MTDGAANPPRRRRITDAQGRIGPAGPAGCRRGGRRHARIAGARLSSLSAGFGTYRRGGRRDGEPIAGKIETVNPKP